MIVSDKEFWLELATHMENSGTLPTSGPWPNDGLCDCLEDAVIAKVISKTQRARLYKQLKNKYEKFKPIETSYFWSPMAVTPRMNACLELEKDCK